MSDLAKQLEDGRAARRARVRAQIEAVGGVETIIETPRRRKPPARRAKRYSAAKVRQICKEIDLGISDCRRDMPEVAEIDVAHDVAWSILHIYSAEHRGTIGEVCSRYSIDANAFFAQLDRSQA